MNRNEVEYHDERVSLSQRVLILSAYLYAVISVISEYLKGRSMLGEERFFLVYPLLFEP